MASHAEPKRRVVITGMGVIAPNGRTLQTFWESIRDGKSAASYLTRLTIPGGPCQIAAEINDFDASNYYEYKLANRLERSTQYGLAAAQLAVNDAGIDFQRIDPDRAGVVEATSVSNMDAVHRGRKAFDARGHRSVTPSMVLNAYVGSGSAEIANLIKCEGHAITCSSSSASGNDVMGYALSMIKNEDVDVMVAGGSEAPIIDTAFSGFAQSRAMTRWSGEPSKAMKPFDVAGDGFVMGEGAAYVVMEELGHALTRGAKIYAEIRGHGRSCEAYHPMAPHPEGKGVARAMEKALAMAQITPASIDYINAHASANAVNDIAETRAIKAVFGSYARRVAISGTKPITGHALAATGAIETIVCVMALLEHCIPPTINLVHSIPECDLDYVPGIARPFPVSAVMNLNCGFGGKTSCLLLKRYSS